MILPGAGRGTMRGMVEGHRRFTGRREDVLFRTYPSTVLRTVPLPVSGRN